MSHRQTDLVDKITKAMAGHGRHSQLFLWMRENYDRLLAATRLRAERGLVNDWAAMVSELQALGLTDRKGNPPTVNTVRKTWDRVRKDVAREMK